MPTVHSNSEHPVPNDRLKILHHRWRWLESSLHDASRLAPDPGSPVAATRVLLSMGLPTLGLYLAGQGSLAPWAIFGAFTAIYGRVAPTAHRLRVQAGVGLSLVLSVTLGRLVSDTSHIVWGIVLVGSGVAALAGLASLRLGWRPVGPLFQLIAFSVAAQTPVAGGTVDVVIVPALVTLGAAAGAIVITSVVAETPQPALRPGDHQISTRNQWSGAAEYGLSAIIAGTLATASGLEHTYWAMLSAVVPFMAADQASRLLRGIHRIVGTALGLLLGVTVLAMVRPSAAIAIFLVIFLQAGAELLIRRHYGWALVLITPLALIMTQAMDPEPVTNLLVDRMAQTAIGVGTAIALITTRSLSSRAHPSSR